jgi:hypothetical protein
MSLETEEGGILTYSRKVLDDINGFGYDWEAERACLQGLDHDIVSACAN